MVKYLYQQVPVKGSETNDANPEDKSDAILLGTHSDFRFVFP